MLWHFFLRQLHTSPSIGAFSCKTTIKVDNPPIFLWSWIPLKKWWTKYTFPSWIWSYFKIKSHFPTVIFITHFPETHHIKDSHIWRELVDLESFDLFSSLLGNYGGRDGINKHCTVGDGDPCREIPSPQLSSIELQLSYNNCFGSTSKLPFKKREFLLQ